MTYLPIFEDLVGHLRATNYVMLMLNVEGPTECRSEKTLNEQLTRLRPQFDELLCLVAEFTHSALHWRDLSSAIEDILSSSRSEVLSVHEFAVELAVISKPREEYQFNLSDPESFRAQLLELLIYRLTCLVNVCLAVRTRYYYVFQNAHLMPPPVKYLSRIFELVGEVTSTALTTDDLRQRIADWISSKPVRSGLQDEDKACRNAFAKVIQELEVTPEYGP